MTDALYQLLYLIESLTAIVFKVMMIIYAYKFVKCMEKWRQFK